MRAGAPGPYVAVVTRKPRQINVTFLKGLSPQDWLEIRTYMGLHGAWAAVPKKPVSKKPPGPAVTVTADVDRSALPAQDLSWVRRAVSAAAAPSLTLAQHDRDPLFLDALHAESPTRTQVVRLQERYAELAAHVMQAQREADRLTRRD